MSYYYLKSLHIIFVVTWFAGLFYIVRLFIYHVEAQQKEELERNILQKQYKLMMKRLWYIITWPSGVLAVSFGTALIYTNPSYLYQRWMWIKLGFVFALLIYHWVCQKIYSQLQNDILKFSTMKLRILNEISTIILFSIVFLVVLKNSIDWIWGLIGLVGFSVLIMIMVKVYKKLREKKDWEE
ncbi:MAG: CopD family protein [Flavobacteriaceae bacterium]|nr:CopD family protein [Flavobacteriaceae bacterium]